MNRIRMVATLVLAAIVTGCSYQPRFALPVERGSIDAGRQAFIDHRCHACHTVAGVRLPELAGASAPLLELGGETGYVKAYSELVTSIINPNHRISEQYREQMRNRAIAPLTSPMPAAHVDTMTVRQLIDLVAFLDSRYVLVEDYETDF
jgi:mono/diheme cytochrome c family protein